MAMFDAMEKVKEKNTDRAVQRPERFKEHVNHTSIPTQLKERLEESTGVSFDDVRVRYNSDLPARLDALAYTQGNRVEIAPGQERHLPHELGHVVQQKLGLVRANAMHPSGVAMNTDERLERQADEIGSGKKVEIARQAGNSVVQRKPTDKSVKRRNKAQEFFYNMKNDIVEKRLNLYSFIFSDGLGDAGQLKILYDKISSKATELNLKKDNIRMLCVFDVPRMQERLIEEKNTEISIYELNKEKEEVLKKIYTEVSNEIINEQNVTPEETEEKCRKLCGIMEIVEGNENIQFKNLSQLIDMMDALDKLVKLSNGRQLINLDAVYADVVSNPDIKKLPETFKISQIEYDEETAELVNKTRNKIKSICGVADENIKCVGEFEVGLTPKKNIKYRESAFGKLDGAWEVEYPVPDKHFMPGSDHVLKIKEMGQQINLEDDRDIKAGDTAQNGIGYGIPDTLTTLTEQTADNIMTADTFLRNQLPQISQSIDELYEKAWIVSIKKYKGNFNVDDISFEKGSIEAIIAKARDADAKLVIFAGMGEYKSFQQGNTWVIMQNHIPHDTLIDLMAKVQNGVILSGGEGLFVESLATPQENGTASIMAGRYDYQYKEIATALAQMANLGGISITREVWMPGKSKSVPLNINIFKEYRIFAFGKENGPYDEFYYCDKGTFYPLIKLHGKKENIKNLWEGKSGEYMLWFSDKLSALYLPMLLNGNLPMEQPAVFTNGISEMISVFKQYKENFVNESWLKLIDQAAGTAQ